MNPIHLNPTAVKKRYSVAIALKQFFESETGAVWLEIALFAMIARLVGVDVKATMAEYDDRIKRGIKYMADVTTDAKSTDAMNIDGRVTGALFNGLTAAFSPTRLIDAAQKLVWLGIETAHDTADLLASRMEIVAFYNAFGAAIFITPDGDEITGGQILRDVCADVGTGETKAHALLAAIAITGGLDDGTVDQITRLAMPEGGKIVDLEAATIAAIRIGMAQARTAAAMS